MRDLYYLIQEDEFLMTVVHTDQGASTILEQYSSFLRHCTEGGMDSFLELIRQRWSWVDGVVIPFGDHREASYQSVRIVDLKQDRIFLIEKDRYAAAPLETFRQGLLTPADYHPTDPPAPAANPSNFPSPAWTPEISVPPRDKAFLRRIIRDFYFTWLHLFRHELRDQTFSRLAYGLLHIASLDFGLTERAGEDIIPDSKKAYVDMLDLPKWSMPDDHDGLVGVGHVWVAMSKDLAAGLGVVREHASRQETNAQSSRYVILSSHHIVLCHSHGTGLAFAKPVPLWAANNSPSEKAIETLLWATRRPPAQTSLNTLPLEIQDRILFYAARGPIGAARLGVQLGLGSPFAWSVGGRAIKLEDTCRRRTDTTPVEFQIFFDGIMSGLSYSADDSRAGRGTSHEAEVPYWLRSRVQKAEPTVQLADRHLPTAETYLSDETVTEHIEKIESTPGAPGYLYRRLSNALITHLLRHGPSDDFRLEREDQRPDTVPDYLVSQTVRSPAGRVYTRDVCMAECRTPAAAWDATEDECDWHCHNSQNESRTLYAIIQIGLQIRFYTYDPVDRLQPLSSRLDIRDNARDITGWANYMMTYPLPLQDTSLQEEHNN